jgi:C1A family cysteine protease
MSISIYGGTKIDLTGPDSADDHILTVEQLKRLHSRGIFDWDQLYALFSRDSLKVGLKDLLEVSNETLALIEAETERHTSVKNAAKLKRPIRLPFQHGAYPPDDENKITIEQLRSENTASNLNSLKKLSLFQVLTDTVGLELASAVNYVSRLSAPRDQGDRGSCVAFAVTAINEYSFFVKTGRYNNLSEQYLFSETKLRDRDTYCGTTISSALTVLAVKGQCLETKWSYNPHTPCIQTFGKPTNADQDALPYRNGSIPVDRNNVVGNIRGHLSIGHLLAFSIPIYDSWYNNPDTINTGRFILPGIGENPLTGTDGKALGHAMVVVGYQDAEEWPGGGYFIVRNSWGLSWGASNYYGSGYGVIPFEFISTLVWEVYAI